MPTAERMLRYRAVTVIGHPGESDIAAQTVVRQEGKDGGLYSYAVYDRLPRGLSREAAEVFSEALASGDLLLVVRW